VGRVNVLLSYICGDVGSILPNLKKLPGSAFNTVGFNRSARQLRARWLALLD